MNVWISIFAIKTDFASFNFSGFTAVLSTWSFTPSEFYFASRCTLCDWMSISTAENFLFTCWSCIKEKKTKWRDIWHVPLHSCKLKHPFFIKYYEITQSLICGIFGEKVIENHKRFNNQLYHISRNFLARVKSSVLS